MLNNCLHKHQPYVAWAWLMSDSSLLFVLAFKLGPLHKVTYVSLKISKTSSSQPACCFPQTRARITAYLKSSLVSWTAYLSILPHLQSLQHLNDSGAYSLWQQAPNRLALPFFLRVFFFNIYLFESQSHRERDKERTIINWFTPEMSVTTRAGPRWS